MVVSCSNYNMVPGGLMARLKEMKPTARLEWMKKHCDDDIYWKNKYPEAIVKFGDGYSELMDDMIDVAQEERLDAIEAQLAGIAMGLRMNKAAAEYFLSEVVGRIESKVLDSLNQEHTFPAEVTKKLEKYLEDRIEPLAMNFRVMKNDFTTMETNLAIYRKHVNSIPTEFNNFMLDTNNRVEELIRHFKTLESKMRVMVQCSEDAMMVKLDEAKDLAAAKIEELKTAAEPALKDLGEKAEAALDTAKAKIDEAVEAAKPVIAEAAEKADNITSGIADKAHEVTGKAAEATKKKPGFWARLFGAK